MKYQQRLFRIGILITILLVGIVTVYGQQNAAAEAEEYFKRADWPNVIKSYQEITRLEPKNNRAWYRLALAHHTLGQFDNAINAYKQLLTINSNNPVVWYNLACSYARNNNRDLAIESLNSAAQKGFAQINLLENDKDLDSLRTDARFNEVKAAVNKIARPCLTSAEAKQFQFWVGDWDVTVNGQPAGTNNVELVLDECVIMENWTGSQGGTGKSFNFYNASTGKWEQIWIDNQGNKVQLYGEFKDGQMRFTGETIQSNGSKTLQRLTFTKLDQQHVRQFWEQSQDDGKTWTIAFDGLYTRKK